MPYGDIKKQIIDNFNVLPKKEFLVARYITENYDNILCMTLKELSEVIGVSQATVVRFAKSMGFAGFYPFRSALKEEFSVVRSPYMMLKKTRSSDDSHLKAYLDNVMTDVKMLVDLIDLKQIDNAACKILEADTVYLVGVGSDSAVIRHISEYLMLTGIKCIPVCEEGMILKEKILLAGEKDCIFMSSFPTVQQDEYWTAEYAREHGIPFILLTDSEVTAKLLGANDVLIAKDSTGSFFNSNISSLLICNMILLKMQELDYDRIEKALRRYDQAMGQ